jgi:lysophosphatidate acyltransferase
MRKLPGHNYIILPSHTTYLFYLRSAAIYASVTTSITIGLCVALFYQLLNPRKASLGMVIASQIFLFLCHYVAGISVSVCGVENIPSGNKAAIFVANHQSEMDILTIGAMFPYMYDGSVVAKKSLKYLPLLGIFMMATGAIFVDRASTGYSVKTPNLSPSPSSTIIQTTARQVRKQKKSIFIFPEGTRSYFSTPKMLPFRSGAFRISIEANVPVVPVVVGNYNHIYNPRKRVFNRGVIKITVLETVWAGTETCTGTGEDEDGRVRALSERVNAVMVKELEAIGTRQGKNLGHSPGDHASVGSS